MYRLMYRKSKRGNLPDDNGFKCNGQKYNRSLIYCLFSCEGISQWSLVIGISNI